MLFINIFLINEFWFEGIMWKEVLTKQHLGTALHQDKLTKPNADNSFPIRIYAKIEE